MLPDLDENVSFVVDQGSPVGPIPMRSIIDSIRSGERAPDVLVWWAGATDWVAFSNDPALLDLLQELPATNQPPPPAEPEAVERLTPDEAEGVTPEQADVSENKFPEPEVRTFDVSEPFFDPAAEAEADALLARDSRSMHPSASWGDEEASLETTAIDTDAIQRAVAEQHAPDTTGADTTGTDAVEQGALETSAIDPAIMDGLIADSAAPDQPEDASDAAESDDAMHRGLTGLFGSARREASGNAPAAETPRVEEEVAPSSLENVGARIEALTSATRRSQQGGAIVIDESELVGSHVEAVEAVEAVETKLADTDAEYIDSAPGSEAEADATGADIEPGVVSDVNDSDTEAEFAKTEPEAEVEFIEAPDEEVEEVEEVEGVDAEHSDGQIEASAGSWQAVDGEPDLEDRFSEMVRLSVAHQRRIDWALRPDELLLNSCITAIVERGFVLLDVEHHDDSQRAVFDHHDDSRHVRLELSPLSPVNAAGDPVGRHVQISVAWGRRVQDADAAFATVRAHATDEHVDPGTISCEANMVASSASTSVELIWASSDFVGEDHSVDRPALDASIVAILHALEARWYELFDAAD